MTAPSASSAGNSNHSAIILIAGTWDIAMRTPIGTLRAALTFSAVDGTLQGVAEGKTEQVPLRDLRVEAGHASDGSAHLTWGQSITRPMRLELAFDVTVRGNEMTGHSRAGRLPQSSVSGVRRSG